MTKSKRGEEVIQLQNKLLSPDIDQKQQAIRRIIDAMTRGKDVSMLFMDVVKNMETPSLQLKKLIYLYIISYAKAHPDLAILGINSFRKDSVDKNNPFLRGLAVRTMGCLRIKEITSYLCDPLKSALKDQDPYVRKTGVLCVPKMYQSSPELIEEHGFLKSLQNLLNDGNATVVSNTVAALAICSELKGQPLIKLNDILVQKLLTAMNDCNEWGVVYILDTLSTYIPKDPTQAENIMERVSSRLAHTNSAVALSAIRLIIKYMDYLSHPQSIRAYNNKISSPLITMISRQSEICYIVLKTMNLVLQKRPLLLPKQLKIFFVNYHDPLYVKLEKLEILAKIANNDNILMILHELKQCVQQVDVQFVRKAVRTMGRCAIKLEKMADKCVQCLWQTLKTKIPYVVQEAIIVIRDIFRKYPNKYQGLLADICENLKSLDDPEAKASIVWIIGEYVEMIENADQLMANFAQNFKDQSDVVQQQILISCVKLFLHRPSQGQQILKDLFKYLKQQCENPDLRDRGFIYWRLVSTNIQLAKKVILSERPLISDQSYTLQTELLDKLIQNIGTLSSIYGKQPEQFVKKLKDNANAKQIIEEDAQGLLDKNVKQQNVEFFGEKPKQSVSFANKQQDLIDNTPNQVIYPPKNIPQKQPDLLDITQQTNNKPMPVKANSPSVSLLDDDQPSQNYSTSVPTQKLNNNFATQIISNQPVNFFEENKGQKNENIVIPLVGVLSSNTVSKGQKYSGLEIKAAFQKISNKNYLQMTFENHSQTTFEEIAVKLNVNYFRFQLQNLQIPELQVFKPNQVKSLQLEINRQNDFVQIDGWPYSIECGVKVNDDIFLFHIPCCLSVGFNPDFTLEFEQYKQIAMNKQNKKKQQVLPNKLNIEDFITKLKNNNMILVFRKQKDLSQLMSFGCELFDGTKLTVDVIFDKTNNSANLQTTGPNEKILSYFSHALAMIVHL